MSQFIVEQCPVRSPVGETNTYLLIDSLNKQVIVVDPAGEPEKIQKKIKDSQATPVAILLTHAHFDHIAAVETIKNLWHIPIYCGEADRDLLLFSLKLLTQAGHPLTISVDHWLHGGEELSFGDIHVQVISTPGHSKGSICYYLPAEEVLISGDTLFFESIGRTDFQYEEMQGSYSVLMASLSNIFSTIPDNVKVLPGHGPTTTIAHERRFH